MNTFGDLFKITIFGESHGESIGVIVDGVKPGLDVDPEEMYKLLLRRKSGNVGTTKRSETDYPHILSGVFNGKTTGAPINISFYNENTRSSDYSNFVYHPRPSHADFVANEKYNGFQDYRGGGHFSGRLTLAIVAAGYFAKKMIPFDITSRIIQIGLLKDMEKLDEYISDVTTKGDSVGGIINVSADNMGIGLGEPFFQSLESRISAMMFAIPAVKGIEFGIGFKGIELFGSSYNDCIINGLGKTFTNNNGGINGGISNGNRLDFNVFIKPTPSISTPQETFNFQEKKVSPLAIKGRHDACIALRAPVVLEMGLAIVLADMWLMKNRF